MPCPRSASGTRPTCRTVRPRGDNRHSSRPQGCNLCHPKRTGTRSGKNCFSFGIDIFYRGHRGHAVNKCSKLLLPLINSVPRTSRGQKLSTGDTGDKIALSTGVNPNKCRQFALLATMLSTGWPKLGFFCPRFFPVETPQKSPKVAISATTYRTLRRAAKPTGQGVAAPARAAHRARSGARRHTPGQELATSTGSPAQAARQRPGHRIGNALPGGVLCARGNPHRAHFRQCAQPSATPAQRQPARQAHPAAAWADTGNSTTRPHPQHNTARPK